MIYKPKPIGDHYTESFTVNSSTLVKQLRDNQVRDNEIDRIIDFISKIYCTHLSKILADYEKDSMSLENAPSPLKLFIDCIAQYIESANHSNSFTIKTDINSPSSVSTNRDKNDISYIQISKYALVILKNYTKAWEDWM